MPVKNSRSGDGQPFSRIDFFTEMNPLRNMEIVPELENSLYENRSQRGLSNCREEAHPVWNRACL
jgi:hypothetical protein